MNSLKPYWKMVKFGEVVKNANLVERDPEANGVERIVGLEHIDPENLHIRRWNSVAGGTSFSRKFVSGQTLFGKRRAYQRKVAYAEFVGICSGDILTFEPKDKRVLLPELLPFICQSDAFFDYALDTSAGSLSPRTSWTALKDFEFPLPPIDEQKRIAEILWAADEAIESWGVAERSLARTPNALIKQYLKDKSKGAIRLGDTGIQIIDGDRGKNYPKASEYLNTDQGYCLFLSAKNVTKEGFSFVENQFVSKEKDQALRKGKLRRGDLVLTTRGTVGNVAIYDDTVEYDHLRINSGMVILRNETESVQTEFLYKLFTSQFIQKQINRMSYGSAQPQLSVKIIQGIELPNIGIQEQKHLSSVIGQIIAQIASVRSNIENLKAVAGNYWSQKMTGLDGASYV